MFAKFPDSMLCVEFFQFVFFDKCSQNTFNSNACDVDGCGISFVAKKNGRCFNAGNGRIHPIFWMEKLVSVFVSVIHPIPFFPNI